MATVARYRFHAVVDVILVLAALFACFLLAYRQFFAMTPGVVRSPSALRAERLPPAEWDALKGEARWLSSNHGGVEVVVFVDVECPFCRRLDEGLRQVGKMMDDSLVVGFVHFPLKQHRFALLGAKALECTSSTAGYAMLLSALLEDQDSLGIKSWGRFGQDASEPDTAAFSRCVMREGIPPAVAAGRQIGTEIGVSGTPAVIVAGWKLSSAPSLQQLTSIVRAVSRGRAVDDAVRESASAAPE